MWSVADCINVLTKMNVWVRKTKIGLALMKLLRVNR